MKLFIIGGKANSGKNELAKLIKEYYDLKNKKSIITEYSKYVKLYTHEMFNINYSDPKPRKILQDLGEVSRKLVNPQIFIDRMIEDITIFKEYYDNIIISDARLIPEITLMKSKYKNCYTIHLLSNRENDLSEKEKQHITEIEFDKFNDFDYELINDDLNNLKKDIYKILDDIESSEEK